MLTLMLRPAAPRSFSYAWYAAVVQSCSVGSIVGGRYHRYSRGKSEPSNRLSCSMYRLWLRSFVMAQPAYRLFRVAKAADRATSSAPRYEAD